MEPVCSLIHLYADFGWMRLPLLGIPRFTRVSSIGHLGQKEDTISYLGCRSETDCMGCAV